MQRSQNDFNPENFETSLPVRMLLCQIRLLIYVFPSNVIYFHRRLDYNPHLSSTELIKKISMHREINFPKIANLLVQTNIVICHIRNVKHRFRTTHAKPNHV